MELSALSLRLRALSVLRGHCGLEQRRDHVHCGCTVIIGCQRSSGCGCLDAVVLQCLEHGCGTVGGGGLTEDAVEHQVGDIGLALILKELCEELALECAGGHFVGADVNSLLIQYGGIARETVYEYDRNIACGLDTLCSGLGVYHVDNDGIFTCGNRGFDVLDHLAGVTVGILGGQVDAGVLCSGLSGCLHFAEPLIALAHDQRYLVAAAAVCAVALLCATAAACQLADGDLQFSDTTAGALLRYERTSGDSRLVIVVNRGHQYAETKIDALYALDLLSGEGFAYADPDGLIVSVPPETAYILRCVNAAD